MPELRRLEADLRATVKPLARPGLACIGLGRANELLAADLQAQMLEGRRRCGFRSVRFHGIFHDDMGVLTESSPERRLLSFQYIDRVFDFLVEAGFHPFVEFSYMPKPLISGEKTVFWWRANVTPPNDYAAWEDLIEATVRHWRRRYGLAVMRNWRFECWNEPDHRSFWDGTETDYFRLYEVTARAVKNVSPDLRIGGPASAMEDILPRFLAHCHQTEAPLDFLSTHTYANFMNDELDFLGNQTSSMSRDPGAIARAVERVRNLMDVSPFSGRELHYTEWNSSYLYGDPVHDHHFSAPFVLEQLRGVGDKAASMSFWTLSDLFEEKGPPQRPFHGGYGMMTTQGIRKPSWFAHEMLNRLHDEQLPSQDGRCFITRQGTASARILFWNLTLPPEDALNQQHFTRTQEPPVREQAELELKGIEPGRYRFSVTRIGHGHQDPFGDYLAWGSPESLTRDEVEILKSRHNGSPDRVTTVSIDESGSFQEKFQLHENDVCLVELERV